VEWVIFSARRLRKGGEEDCPPLFGKKAQASAAEHHPYFTPQEKRERQNEREDTGRPASRFFFADVKEEGDAVVA